MLFEDGQGCLELIEIPDYFPVTPMNKSLILLLILLSIGAWADTLPQQVTQFFRQRDPLYASQTEVTVRTPPGQWPDCPAPEFSLPGNSRRWGNLTLTAQCGRSRHFLQVVVAVTGTYYVARQRIPRGSEVTLAQLTPCQGRLDRLPARVLLDISSALPAIALQNLSPGKVILTSLLRKPWRVRNGDNVRVIVQGPGFSAATAGKALNNAATGDQVRVRTPAGQLIVATVDDQGVLQAATN
ncbi:flagellar basal body P-ring formation chaperone FlgA [Tatumella terrea]